jgi:hypothetical protein
MKILKTSALAAVLALGSLSANANYSDSSSFNLQIQTSDAVSVSFAENTMLFDDVIPNDTLDGQIGVTITGDANHTMTCDINGESIDAATDADIQIQHDPDNTVSGDEYIVTDLSFGLDDCSAAATTLTVDGTINAAALPGVLTQTQVTLTVSYGAAEVVQGVNSNQ